MTPVSIRTRILLVTAGVLTSAGSVLAQDSAFQASHTESSRFQSPEDIALDDRLASEWELKSDEWTRYRQLMRGPLGVYSPNLDPLTALGIEARSDEERRHIAELQVRAEGRRAEKTLAYQRAYDEAWRQLYPNLPPFLAAPEAQEKLTSVAPPSANGTTRLAVFIKDDCPPCDERVRQLQQASRPFDVYMVGSRHDDGRIREWAARVGVDPLKVKAQVITLNHDAGRWLSLGGQGVLPAVITEVDGQWRRD